MNDKLGLVQDRISKLIDMHIDGKIDAETYHYKLADYKQEQQRLLLEIKTYETSSQDELNIAREALKIVSDIKEIFVSSKLNEKQQLLNFMFSNLRLDGEKLDLELREPFNLMANMQEGHIWRG